MACTLIIDRALTIASTAINDRREIARERKSRSQYFYEFYLLNSYSDFEDLCSDRVFSLEFFANLYVQCDRVSVH
jgi:hypothetical protein